MSRSGPTRSTRFLIVAVVGGCLVSSCGRPTAPSASTSGGPSAGDASAGGPSASTVAPTSSAPSPDRNGRFVFTWNVPVPEEVSTDFLASSAPDATDLRVIADCNYECHHRDGAWSPDGTHLLFTQEFDQSPSQLVIVNADGRKPVVLRTGDVSSPTWSPDGRRVAFISSSWPKGADDWVSDVFVVDRDGSGLTQITRTPEDEADLAWSDTGSLAFRRSRDRSDAETYEVWTMLPDGSNLRRLTAEGQQGAAPDWAPGGDRLAFVRDGAVWTMSAAGTDATQLAGGHSPTWAPDGSVIAYIADDGAIHTISPTGTGDVRIGSPITKGSMSALDWQPLPMEQGT